MSIRRVRGRRIARPYPRPARRPEPPYPGAAPCAGCPSGGLSDVYHDTATVIRFVLRVQRVRKLYLICFHRPA